MISRLFVLGSLGLLPGFALADFQNGSFELPDLGTVPATQAYYIDPSAPLLDWSITGQSYAAVLTNQDTGFFYDDTIWTPTPDGNQFIYINAFAELDTLSQTVEVSAGPQTLQFIQADYLTAYATPGGIVDVSIVDPSNNLVAYQQFTTVDYSPFIQQSLSFDAPTTGAYTFYFASESGHSAIIDGVTLGTPTATPGPAALLSFGLPALGLLRRRTRTA